ncbi:MAG: hypothetical protein MI867_23380 [Pseudomonadales bacterium]|nr:hypothetical protein [Pseudomonadales bacterium]
MFELERQAYLKALGIVQYIPQDAIEGAKESALLTDDDIYPPGYFVEESEVNTIQPSEAHLTQSPSAAPVAAQRPAVQPNEVKQQAPSVQQATQPELASTEGLRVSIPQELLGEEAPRARAGKSTHLASSSSFEFCLAWIETRQGIAFLVELGDAGVKDLSAQEHRLMGDIYKALQVPEDQCRHQFFKWPLVNNPKIKQGEEEARETLSGYLESKVANQPVSAVVLMGELPERLLAPNGQQLVLGGQQLITVASPSLNLMLNQWQSKARAWRALAPLRGRRF